MSEPVQRSVEAVIPAIRQLEGGGFEVRRPFPTASLPQVDPFLLLDHMGPVALGPGEAKGAPDHPHRGFETVTYMIEGTMEHEDSAGHAGRIGPGDVQWMTAGAGVIHAEMPIEQIQAVLRAPDLTARNRLIADHLSQLEQDLTRTQQAVASLRD